MLAGLMIAILCGNEPAQAASDGSDMDSWTPKAIGHPSFLSPHSRPILPHEGLVFVLNTPADTVDIFRAEERTLLTRISVGIDPVSLAARPDGNEVWVSNHVSDSVSVLDTNPESPTYLNVIATIQDIDAETRSTRFDEPVGIAFANNEKAYVALSSENQIAVVDVVTRRVQKRLRIPAQDPRAIVVRGDRLFVIPFESNNKTQLSGGYKIDGELVTFNAHEHSIAVNNVLSLGHKTDIVKHPRVPDHDLFIFDTKTDELVDTVDSLGTLLYGLAVDTEGAVYITQADARNDANGRAGTQAHGMAELENRPFLNRITRVDFSDGGATPHFFDLEPLPPQDPDRLDAVATPFAIQISNDDSTLFVTAAGSDQLLSIDATTGAILGRATIDHTPRGIALRSDEHGRTTEAWVLNAVANTLSVVDVTNVERLRVRTTLALEDPTHANFKRGRIAFNTADTSSTATFSCASCHPDGHTDQLLWVLKTPIVTGGDQIMPRSTMPVRGLRDTEPYHWDGIPGDPYGGINSASIHAAVPPNSDASDPRTSTRHLVDGGLATTMLKDGDKTENDEGKEGFLTRSERDALAEFLLGVPYPPSQRRSYSNELSERAKEGFELFHIIGDVQGTPGANLCGNCHRMPHWVSTNTPGTGMDAPTWRGAYDRFLILPQGRLNIIDFDFYRRVAEKGNDEREIWRFSWGGREAFDPVWDMVLEGSVGFSGSFARQLTLNEATADSKFADDLLAALETSAKEGAIVLQADGVFVRNESGRRETLQFDVNRSDGLYVSIRNPSKSYTRARLTRLASKGRFVGTFTGRHGAHDDIDAPQPALWTEGPIQEQRGKQEFPRISEANLTMAMSGRHIDQTAQLVVNGRQAAGTINLESNERVVVSLASPPAPGLNFLQVQNPDGRFSNDFIFHMIDEETERELQALDALITSIEAGDIEGVRGALHSGAKADAKPDDGESLISKAAIRGETEIIQTLLEAGANVSAANQDGNTPLHIAAFMCHEDTVQTLLAHGASAETKNNRGESAKDVVSSDWSDGLAQFYQAIGRSISRDVDLEHIQKTRPVLAALLEGQVASR